ncbi:ankyrin repeat-containing protein BDA1 isoform X2 [Quercus suber]|uniref:ankyrin repeat-containing protein BDA1 isoform X2 n=1 Tax=Quercus suber TaxID=58331 RepID=UPI0032DEBCFA
MNEGMKQAAESGDINALHQLIGEDVNLLDHIDHVQCVQTPLHIATSAGHIQFSTEMMGLKPSFAWKLNPNGFSPIHLALKNGHIELVRQLLEIDRNLAHVKGNECINPLHYVVETGDRHIDLLENFLLVCPDSITDVTVRDETALHIALKNDQLEAFKFLVGWLGRNFCKNSSSIFKHSSSNVKAVLDQKDDEGNTVLHITVSKNQTQVVSHILTWGFRFIDVNSTNLEDKTTWDISQGQTQVDSREIRLMLHSAGPSSATSYGNIQFALETTSLKPSFARKLNQNGFSPIHLALKNEHIELVRRLLQIDGNLVRVKGKECLTPLHYVAKSCSENLDLLKEFLLVCPDSITDVTVRNETALHIALKYNRLKTFKFIMRWLARNCTKIDKFNVRTTLNWKDNEGNTVLHIAVSKNQTQAVRHLLAWGSSFAGVNHKNMEGKTA